MTRILVLVPFALDDEQIANRSAQTREITLGSNVSFHYKPVVAGPTSFTSPHDWLLLDLGLFEAGLSAEADGFDAVVIDTVSDSGADALRSVLDIPVLAPGRASLLFALTLGRRFGVLAQWQPALARYEKVLDEWGLRSRCAGVEHFDTPPDFANLLAGKEDVVVPKMEAACRRLVDRGADVICLGSTTMHEAHGHLSSVLDVPVVNPGPLSYKLIQMMLSLGLSHSRAAYPRPQVPKIDMIHTMLAAAEEVDRV
ncbi:MAG: aspartate/glutamate racemase family protein [Acidimicrobiia bacterium]|nr:aspartate/glutamate racemase family protein [Acidimicrobiia bacterium]